MVGVDDDGDGGGDGDKSNRYSDRSVTNHVRLVQKHAGEWRKLKRSNNSTTAVLYIPLL